MTVRGPVFLDTSGLFAAAEPPSPGNALVREALERLLRSGIPLVTSDVVVAELHGLTLGRLGPSVALSAARRIMGAPRVEIVSSGPAWLESGLAFLVARPGRRISMTDAVSMLLMRERDIDTVFTLDGDFRAEGFATIPS